MGLGAYPDVPVVDVLKAATKARAIIAAGLDPIEQRGVDAATPTFEQAARRRHDQVKDSFRNEKHKQDWIRSLEMYVFDAIGHVRVDKLTPRDFADALRPAWLDRMETASRVKQRCGDVMAMCWAEGIIAGNPVAVVDKLLPKQQRVERHQPAMPWASLPDWVQAHLMQTPRLGSKAALLFLILTAARSGEVRGLTWREVDMQSRLWTVPAERMKAHRAHRVPLSTQAIDLLEEQLAATDGRPNDQPVFPSLRRKELSDMALSSLLRRVNAPSDIDGRTATAHGFRSSFRNWAADSGYDSAVAERALAHQIANKVQAAYERTDRLEARIQMMQAWGDFVTSCR